MCKKVHCIKVTLDALTNKVCSGNTGQHVGVTETFASVDVGHVDVYNGDIQALDTIAQSVAIVGVGTGIEHYCIAIGLLKDVDKFALDVALCANKLATKALGVCLHLLLQCCKGVATVQSVVALAEHVHVYTV